MTDYDVTFDCMGCEVRLLIGAPLRPEFPSAAEAASAARAWLAQFDARLSRFSPASELSVCNRDERSTLPVSRLLAAAIGAGLWAARKTGGLLDPTLVGALETAGYSDSRPSKRSGEVVAQALLVAPPRRSARPRPQQEWQAISVDLAHGALTRPTGMRLDTGGTGKGLAADALAERFMGYARFAVDCAGDIRVGGPDAGARPYEIQVEHPITGRPVCALAVGDGAVATSGLGSRIWRLPGGGFAHHLIDPATGEPAWTGILAATALAPNALEAETLAKFALLSGPPRARAVLARHGGVLVHDDGSSEAVAGSRLRLSSRYEPAAA
jgi:thiamine biosynthesis lipoprotein